MKQDLCSECSGYFRIFLKLGVALRGMIPYNEVIGSDVLARHRGGIVGSRPLSKENNLWKITKPEGTGMRYQYPLFSFLLLCGSFVFSMDCLFWRVVFLCAESYGKGRSYGEDGADTDG